MNEETIQAARRAWANDPEAAAQALLGCSAEELFITALRGCNQHKHKPGCPDADGGGHESVKKSNRDVYQIYNNRTGKLESVAEEEIFDFIDDGFTTATITSDESGLTIEAGEDKRTFKFGVRDAKSKMREFVARAFGSFDYEENGKPALDAHALDEIIDMARKNKSVTLAVFGDYNG